jgi:hypothetical protein
VRVPSARACASRTSIPDEGWRVEAEAIGIKVKKSADLKGNDKAIAI